MCKNPNDYQKEKKITAGGREMTCDYFASSSQHPLTSETKDCSNPHTNLMSVHYGCCGTGPGACALDYSYGVFVFVCL